MPKTKDGHTEEYWTRVDEVVVMLLDNDSYLTAKRSEVFTNVVAEHFGVSIRQAQRYIAAAKREVRRIGKEKRDKAFLKAMRDREFLLQKAKMTDDYKLALEILKDRDKLFGLYVDEVRHSGAVNYNVKIVEDLDE